MENSLIKGQKIDLTKNIEDLNYVHIGIDWKSMSGLDLDASAFLLDENEKIGSEDDFIFYGQPQSSNKSVRLEDSISTIEKQRFVTSLWNVPNEVQKISFTLTIYEAKLKGLTFSDVDKIRLRIINSKTQEEIANFPIDYSFTKESAIVLGSLYRFANEWKFHAVGAGFNGGLADLCQQYGLDVIEETEASSPETVSMSPYSRFQTVQERDSLETGEKIPPQPNEHLELKRSSVIQFDQGRISELSVQSTNLVELFEDQSESNLKPQVSESNSSNSLNFFEDTETDFEGFLESLTNIEKIFLQQLNNGQISVVDAHKFFRENLTMPAVFLNAINEKANNYLGENLLLENREIIHVDEEFDLVLENLKERDENEY